LKFILRVGEGRFSYPLCFNANDIDSKSFESREDKICFIKQSGEYKREKLCKAPSIAPAKIGKLFKRKMEACKKESSITLTEKFVELLDDGLSHIEFSSTGKFKAVQRDIYAGSLITITKSKNKGLIKSSDKIKPFKPVGIRTNDFIALYSFANSVCFYFGDKNVVAFESKDNKMPFSGILSLCKYDEIGRT
jgi:hypothetical protein